MNRTRRTLLTPAEKALTVGAAVSLVISAGASAGIMRADDSTAYTWVGTSSNDWRDPANWMPDSPAPPPDDNDSATIPEAQRINGQWPAAYNETLERWDINVTRATSLGQLTVTGDTTIRLGRTLTVQGLSGLSLDVNGYLAVSRADGSTGKKKIDVKKAVRVGHTSNGTLVANSNTDVTIGGNVDLGGAGSGTLDANGNSSYTVTGDVNVGNSGSGTVNANSSSTVTVNGNVNVGNGGTGAVNANHGSTVTVNGDVNVGKSGSGTVDVNNGAKVKVNGNLGVGDNGSGTVNTDSSKNVNVTGNVRVGGRQAQGTINADSNITIGGNVNLGGNSEGTINVGQDATVTTNGTTTVGSSPDSGTGKKGKIKVKDKGTYRAKGDVIVGDSTVSGAKGQGEIDVDKRGKVNAFGNDIIIEEDSSISGKGSISPPKRTHKHYKAGSVKNAGLMYSTGLTGIDADVEIFDTGVIDLGMAGDVRDSEYDGFNIYGDLILHDATLSLHLDDGYEPLAGTHFRLVRADSITGQFDSLPNGAHFDVSGHTMRINYRTDAGSSSVFATAVPSPGTLMLTVTGALLALGRRRRNPSL